MYFNCPSNGPECGTSDVQIWDFDNIVLNKYTLGHFKSGVLDVLGLIINYSIYLSIIAKLYMYI